MDEAAEVNGNEDGIAANLGFLEDARDNGSM